MRAFVSSALDHAANDAKTPYQGVRVRYEEWKQGRMDKHSKQREAEEGYIVNYANRRSEYEQAYADWRSARDSIIRKMKDTSIIGEQERLMADLLRMPFPEVLRSPVMDVYTSHKQYV
jgi:hypothetical protein